MDISSESREEGGEIIMVKKRTIFLVESFFGGVVFLAGLFATMLAFAPSLDQSTKILAWIIGVFFIGVSLAILVFAIKEIR